LGKVPVFYKIIIPGLDAPTSNGTYSKLLRYLNWGKLDGFGLDLQFVSRFTYKEEYLGFYDLKQKASWL
jgi:hypothetical protein